MLNNALTALFDELLERGFDVTLLKMFPSISYKSGYQTTVLIADDEDDASWNGAKMMSNNIAPDNDLNLEEKLFICNQFNKASNYCSAYLSDNDNELFMVSSCVPANCDNFVEICADMFEETINATEFLIDLIENY